MRFSRALALPGLLALSDCSLAFDPGPLGSRPPALADATTGGGEDAGNLDDRSDDVAATDREASASDGDGNPPETAADDSASLDGVVDGDSSAELDTSGNAGGDAPAADADGEADAAPLDAGDAGTLAVDLVAFYSFEEMSGTTSVDVSGNGHTATMNGATFAPGLRGRAAKMNGSGQYVSLPAGIVSGLTSCSIGGWVNFVTTSTWMRIFDFGTSPSQYMHLTRDKFAITLGGQYAEQRTAIPSLPAGSWQHVVLTLAGGVSTLYVNGVQVAQNATVTLTPASLGVSTQNWLGRSQYSADPYLNGEIDEFRIYGRALTASEVQDLFQMR